MIEESLKDGSFIRLTLGKPMGDRFKKLIVRPVETKKGVFLQFRFREEARETAKNFTGAEAVKEIDSLIGTLFLSAHLFTSASDVQLEANKKGSSRLSKSTATKKPSSLSHDREKQSVVNPKSSYLEALGITTQNGDVRANQRDKWRQINRFIETLDSLLSKSDLLSKEEIVVADMGCGKGYLTFATYEHLTEKLGKAVTMVGVEVRESLVDACNEIAVSCDFDGLRFRAGTIESSDVGKVDVLIALHACDTATDDAIFKGIEGGASLIVTAPCCHKEIRPQITVPESLRGMLGHGTLLEREAESVTDSMRALLLGSEGYETSVFEFISSEHTPKNNMIAAVAGLARGHRVRAIEDFAKLKAFYGIGKQRLEELLGARKAL